MVAVPSSCLVIPFLLFVTVFPADATVAYCNPQSGPAGETVCLPYPDRITDNAQYNVLETCMSNSYINQKTSGKFTCPNETTYCKVLCTQELFSEERPKTDEMPMRAISLGNVSHVVRACECYESPQKPTLPGDCLSPDGTDCTWYRRCLAVQYPCGGQAGYALGYGERMCNLYEDRLPVFSERGQAWIGAVRKCLQVQLVPVLRPYSYGHPPYTCYELKQYAFKTHIPCYLDPYQGFSVCNLSCVDFGRIFWTIKSTFLSDFWASFNGAIETVMNGCISTAAVHSGCFGLVQKMYISVKLLLNEQLLRKRSISQTGNSDDVMDLVMTSLVNQLGWCRNIGWHAYAFKQMTGSTLQIEVLLADLPQLGLREVDCTGTIRSVNDAMEQLKKSINQGLVIRVQQRYDKVTVTSVSGCSQQRQHFHHDSCDPVLLASSSGSPAGSLETLSSRWSFLLISSGLLLLLKFT